MPRRIALALSLVFTTLVTFGIVAVGANAGFFSDAKKAATTQKAEAAAQPGPDDAAAALRYLAAVGAKPQAAAQPSAPRVVTEYVYLYETPAAGTRAGAAAAQNRATSPIQPSAAPPQSSGLPNSRERSPDGGSPGPSTTPGPGVQPTLPPAAPTTAPGAPASTPTTAPPASPTPVPAQSTAVPPQPTPTTAPAGAACSDEFVARVTATTPMTGGNLVTWSNGVQTRLLDSTPHASALHVGVTAHVHTTASGCTITEIELD